MLFGLFSKNKYNKFKVNESCDREYINNKNGVLKTSFDRDCGWTHGIGIIIDKSFTIIGMIQHSQITKSKIELNDIIINIDDVPIETIPNVQFHLKGEPNSSIKVKVKKPNGSTVSCTLKRDIDSRKIYRLSDVFYNENEPGIVKKIIYNQNY